MSNVSPELNQLVQESKRAGLPSEADAVRVLEALRARFSEPAVFGASRALTSSSTRLVLPKVTTIALAGIALFGGLRLLAPSNQSIAPRESLVSSSSRAAENSAPPLATNAPLATESLAVPVSASAPAVAVSRSDLRPTPARPAHDTLAEEVAILSNAEMELHRGKPENALTLLREHEKRFANGVLREERIAARVQALCALGRTTDADAQEGLLSPNSLHAHQSHRACTKR